MKKRILYLHVGWSKTGTSAIQSQVQKQHKSFLENGILYPQTIQWIDHSHHPFALSFCQHGPYQSTITAEAAIERLASEMNSSHTESVLISSELSPVYFENIAFKEFTEKTFSQVKLIFTLRCQSELISSLFNQLVKDDNTRYQSSIFTLGMQKIKWLNFHEEIKKWVKFVGIKNIEILHYDKDIVERFISLFGIAPQKSDSTENTNPSLPHRCLPAIQELCRGIDNPIQYKETREKIVEISKAIPLENDTLELFSTDEQISFDQYFIESNILLEKELGFDASKIMKTNYTSLMAIPPKLINLY